MKKTTSAITYIVLIHKDISIQISHYIPVMLPTKVYIKTVHFSYINTSISPLVFNSTLSNLEHRQLDKNPVQIPL